MKRILTHNLLRSAEKYPNRVAFKQMDASVTYTDLVAKSNQVANHLLSIGVKKGDRVGVFMNRSLESCFTVYGIMLAGAAYVPIDTNLPTHRIKIIIDDCNLTTLISKPTFKKNISGVLEEETCLKYLIGLNPDESNQLTYCTWDQIFTLSTAPVDVEVTESDIAYIIYTSGTTGHPKGIVHTHYSGSSYAKLSADLYHLTHEDILGNHSHLHYDISTMGYLTMPYIGGCTVIVPEAHTMFPASLAKLIADEQLTLWYSVPLALIQMMQSGGMSTHDYSQLRWILYGGETFAYKQIMQLLDTLPHTSISNVYGPAEVNQCTYYNFDRKSVLNDPVPLGNVWPETEVKLLDIDPLTQEGELAVASSTQMDGYWNRPEKTASSFIEFEGENGESKRYYKTGDIGSLNDDGHLMFCGRQDRQVKVRGYRVELNEIETLLLQHGTISGAAAYAVKADDANVIHACIVTEQEEVNQKELNKYLSIKLPAYSLPQTITKVNKIPRTPAGKVDYKSLTQ